MFLQRVRLRNFRGFVDSTLDLRPALNVLVGRNNTGKTNLFAAIRHALGPGAARADNLWLTLDDVHRQHGQDPTGPVQIDLTFADLTQGELAQFFEVVDFNVADPARSTAQIHFEAVWLPDRSRFSVKRWGGPEDGERTPVPSEILESLPVTYLPALRDAEAALSPGNRNRLAALLQDLCQRRAQHDLDNIKAIFAGANDKLEAEPVVVHVRDALRSSTNDMAGSDYLPCSVKATELDGTRILRGLKVILDEAPVADLQANGLGYNNLLYIATVLTHLSTPAAGDCPLLLVEEPEAHLHPQLTVSLAEYFTDLAACPQVVVSTHSPTFAAKVKPHQVRTIHRDGQGAVAIGTLANCGLDDRESRRLQRMLDITRASLYFSKGLILVEGISEVLLLPALAKRLGHDLIESQVSVVEVCGVNFEVFAKLFGDLGLAMPVAIVTDSDPPVKRQSEGTWQSDLPERNGGGYRQSDRAARLLELYQDHPAVKAFASDVTLEFDLAFAGPQNAALMTECWVSCFRGTPQTLNAAVLATAGDDAGQRALAVWRGICRAQHTGSKAEFAHVLADRLLSDESQTDIVAQFEVPPYLRGAIEHVLGVRAVVATTAEGA